jgi:hypothetical protein
VVVGRAAHEATGFDKDALNRSMKISVPTMGPNSNIKQWKRNFLNILSLKAAYLIPQLAIRELGAWLDEQAQHYAYTLLLHVTTDNKRVDHAMKSTAGDVTAGDVSRFKARFVAKGCSQRDGLDYTETVSLVIHMASLRLLLAIAAARDLELCQLDIDTAFLYAPIKEDVYIRQPLGFTDGTFKVCHLKRCLYGLKQPPREFNMLLREWLVDHGWQQCV